MYAENGKTITWFDALKMYNSPESVLRRAIFKHVIEDINGTTERLMNSFWGVK